MVLAVELESAPVAASCMEGRPTKLVLPLYLVKLCMSTSSFVVADAQFYGSRFVLAALECAVFAHGCKWKPASVS